MKNYHFSQNQALLELIDEGEKILAKAAVQITLRWMSKKFELKQTREENWTTLDPKIEGLSLTDLQPHGNNETGKTRLTERYFYAIF